MQTYDHNDIYFFMPTFLPRLPWSTRVTYYQQNYTLHPAKVTNMLIRAIVIRCLITTDHLFNTTMSSLWHGVGTVVTACWPMIHTQTQQRSTMYCLHRLEWWYIISVGYTYQVIIRSSDKSVNDRHQCNTCSVVRGMGNRLEQIMICHPCFRTLLHCNPCDLLLLYHSTCEQGGLKVFVVLRRESAHASPIINKI